MVRAQRDTDNHSDLFVLIYFLLTYQRRIYAYVPEGIFEYVVSDKNPLILSISFIVNLKLEQYVARHIAGPAAV